MKHCQQEMTVIQNAWPVVCNFGWLIEADRNARKGKRYRAEVLNFTARLEDTLFTIQQSFFVEQVINRLGFEDIFQGDEDKRAYYMFLVPELYYALRGEQLPEGTNILTYWKRKCSLGEIHTVSMCLVTSCSLFLSDDGDSKALMNIVLEKFAAHIDVYNRNDVIACYQNSGATGLSRNDKRAFLHKT